LPQVPLWEEMERWKMIMSMLSEIKEVYSLRLRRCVGIFWNILGELNSTYNNYCYHTCNYSHICPNTTHSPSLSFLCSE
jgi:hypothetical protein